MILVALTLVGLYAAFMAWICWQTVLDDAYADELDGYDESSHSALCLASRSDDQVADDTETGPASRTAGVVGFLVAGAHRSPAGAVGSDSPGHH